LFFFRHRWRQKEEKFPRYESFYLLVSCFEKHFLAVSLDKAEIDGNDDSHDFRLLFANEERLGASATRLQFFLFLEQTNFSSTTNVVLRRSNR
jgi:hypothetical protein